MIFICNCIKFSKIYLDESNGGNFFRPLEKLVFIMGMANSVVGGGGVGAIDFTGTRNFLCVLAYSSAMALYMDGFLNKLCRV